MTTGPLTLARAYLLSALASGGVLTGNNDSLN